MQSLKDWWPVLATILAAGIWLGALQQRVVELERYQRYEHGSYNLPEGAK